MVRKTGQDHDDEGIMVDPGSTRSIICGDERTGRAKNGREGFILVDHSARVWTIGSTGHHSAAAYGATSRKLCNLDRPSAGFMFDREFDWRPVAVKGHSVSAVVAVVFANLKGNLGDFAILHSMLADIHQSKPGCRIEVYSQPFLPVDAHRLAAFQRLAPPFEYKGTMAADPGPPTPLAVRLLRASGLLRHYQDRRISRLAKSAEEPFGSQFANYDAVYLAGGAQWTGVNAAASMFANLRAIARYNREIYAYPFSVSSSLTKVSTKASLAADFARISAPLIARDSGTRDALMALGVDAISGADCVFALGSLFERERDTGEAGTRLLFVLTNQSADEIVRAVGAATEAGFSPAILSTCAIEDAPSQAEAARRSGAPFIEPLTWQDVVAEMNRSAIVVSNRLHGLILSSFSSACLMPLTDREKVRAVVRDATLPVSLERLAQLDDVRLTAAQERRDEMKAKLRNYREKAVRMPWSPMGATRR
jgi:polysaccharide pyruvyl transferase WcaK-like protein